MSDIFGSPDFSGAATKGGNLWNQIMGEVQPSQASIDQVGKMQNQMGNQFYNQGLSGSTIEQQALGQGETQAFDADQMAQAHQILGLTGGELAAQQQQKMAPWELGGEALGGFAGAGGIPGIEKLFGMGGSSTTPSTGLGGLGAAGGPGGYLSNLIDTMGIGAFSQLLGMF